MINQLLVIQEAAKDSLLGISEEELEDRVQQQMDGQVIGFGTLGALQRALAEQNMTKPAKWLSCRRSSAA